MLMFSILFDKYNLMLNWNYRIGFFRMGSILGNSYNLFVQYYTYVKEDIYWYIMFVNRIWEKVLMIN